MNDKFHSGLKLKRNRGPNSGQPRSTVTGTAKVELGLPDATIISNHFHSRIVIKKTFQFKNLRNSLEIVFLNFVSRFLKHCNMKIHELGKVRVFMPKL